MYLPAHTEDMTMREKVFTLLRTDEVHSIGGATNAQICEALGEANYERVLSRMLEELAKTPHICRLETIATRVGKQQQYKYLAFPKLAPQVKTWQMASAQTPVI